MFCKLCIYYVYILNIIICVASIKKQSLQTCKKAYNNQLQYSALHVRAGIYFFTKILSICWLIHHRHNKHIYFINTYKCPFRLVRLTCITTFISSNSNCCNEHIALFPSKVLMSKMSVPFIITSMHLQRHIWNIHQISNQNQNT